MDHGLTDTREVQRRQANPEMQHVHNRTLPKVTRADESELTAINRGVFRVCNARPD
jgi:hypothetical protein